MNTQDRGVQHDSQSRGLFDLCVFAHSRLCVFISNSTRKTRRVSSLSSRLSRVSTHPTDICKKAQFVAVRSITAECAGDDASLRTSAVIFLARKYRIAIERPINILEQYHYFLLRTIPRDKNKQGATNHKSLHHHSKQLIHVPLCIKLHEILVLLPGAQE